MFFTKSRDLIISTELVINEQVLDRHELNTSINVTVFVRPRHFNPSLATIEFYHEASVVPIFYSIFNKRN